MLTIHVSGVAGAVAVENIMFITSAKEKIEFAPLFSQTTGIAGINNLTEPADVYSLDGYLVRKSATSLNDLPKGVYIVNGRKVVK